MKNKPTLDTDYQLVSYLEQLIAKTDLDVSSEQIQLLVAFVERINKWNKAYNLTSVRDPREMLIKHIMDSIVVAPFLEGQRFIDVGTGPGLPGIPLAIMRPDCHFVLLDSLGKRVRFMKQMVFELGIANIEPIHSRVENHQPEVKFDAVLSRAFASLKDMLHWCQHLVDFKGKFLALKGVIPEDELADLSDEFEHVRTDKLVVPHLDGERHLITLIKTERK
ncbi:16S rRNA (guanine(527)-N(7))-methyltransferase RsmG [Alteromonadaceae bacterium M269]|nr:16S rRNA (guanine(527)-N(7))-methyltransferase RsmG [Alteromonadaceae bacterium M269]